MPDPKVILVCGLSRTGTTLLSAMLDAHPCVSMGYELVPPTMGLTPHKLADAAEEAWRESGGSPRRAGNLVKSRLGARAGVFIKRASRALVDPPDLASVLRAHADAERGIHKADDRFALALRIAERKREIEGTLWCGFKGGGVDASRFVKHRARWVIIHRDPRDTLDSHRAVGLATSARELARAWNAMAGTIAEHADRSLHIRYEDLVTQPTDVSSRLCNLLGIELDDAMIRPENSKATVLRTEIRHANHEHLGSGIDTTRIGRWCGSLDEHDARFLGRRCSSGLRALGYEPAAP